MPHETMTDLDFGSPSLHEDSLSERLSGMQGSEILAIASQIRELKRAGRQICDLTVGDFDASQFPIPEPLKRGIHAALDAGHTNYPPSDGVLELRQALTEYTARTLGVRYPVESVLVAGGARPMLFAAYAGLLDAGESVVFPVPSWNNNHYAWIAGAREVKIPTRSDNGFFPTLDELRPHLESVRMIALNSPLNPTGTVIDPGVLRQLTEAVVEENGRRRKDGRRLLFLLWDQVYGELTFGDVRHAHPLALVPEAAPYVVSLDAISKCFAATGLRVGWMMAPPALTRRFKDLVGHMGAWAPRPEQVAVAGFLVDEAACREYGEAMRERVLVRLRELYHGFEGLARDGYPVECIKPQGAIYLSLRLNLIGRQRGDERIETNEQIRRLLLEEAGFAIVPFQAFGLERDSGWFRLSVGAVSLDDIRSSFSRIRRLLDEIA